MKPIFLIGYMGTGKTTLGKVVARKLGCGFIDLDLYIENRYRKSVSDLFALYGADGFRQREKTVLEEVCEFEDVVIACGGGTPCFFDNMSLMNSKGLTVWLTMPVERIYARLSLPGAKTRRPAIAGKSGDELRTFIQKNIEERKKFYGKAVMVFDSTDIETVEETYATADIFIGKLQKHSAGDCRLHKA